MKQNILLRMLAAAAIRHGLTLLTAYLVSQNVPVPDDFVTNVTNYAVDLLPVIVALVWSAIQKSATHDELVQGVLNAAPTPVPAPSVIVVNPAPTPPATE